MKDSRKSESRKERDRGKTENSAPKNSCEERQYNLKIDGKDVADHLTGKMVKLVGYLIPIGVTESGALTFDAGIGETDMSMPMILDTQNAFLYPFGDCQH